MGSSVSNRICGFCMTGHHENCKTEIKWYDNVWYCDCTCKNKETGTAEQQDD